MQYIKFFSIFIFYKLYKHVLELAYFGTQPTKHNKFSRFSIYLFAVEGYFGYIFRYNFSKRWYKNELTIILNPVDSHSCCKFNLHIPIIFVDNSAFGWNKIERIPSGKFVGWVRKCANSIACMCRLRIPLASRHEDFVTAWQHTLICYSYKLEIYVVDMQCDYLLQCWVWHIWEPKVSWE